MPGRDHLKVGRKPGWNGIAAKKGGWRTIEIAASPSSRREDSHMFKHKYYTTFLAKLEIDNRGIILELL
jgi:hypothetical protein